MGLNAMKTTLFVLLILCTASAVGQAGVGVTSGQSSMLEMSGHPEHASQHDLASEQSLLGTASPYSFAQGERPLWEFGPVSQPTPLGDIARAYRKEKQAARKAEVVFEKQGS
jgi:hypothetical protein